MIKNLKVYKKNVEKCIDSRLHNEYNKFMKQMMMQEINFKDGLYVL